MVHRQGKGPKYLLSSLFMFHDVFMCDLLAEATGKGHIPNGRRRVAGNPTPFPKGAKHTHTHTCTHTHTHTRTHMLPNDDDKLLKYQKTKWFTNLHTIDYQTENFPHAVSITSIQSRYGTWCVSVLFSMTTRWKPFYSQNNQRLRIERSPTMIIYVYSGGKGHPFN